MSRVLKHSREALRCLERYPWPGNVRELENAIEHAFVLCRSGMIGLNHLPEQVRPSRDSFIKDGGLSLRDHERQVILDSLIRNNWRRMATARELKIDKNTLRRKIQRFGIYKRST